MTSRLVALVLMTVLASACADAVDRLSPGVFYGYVTTISADELCVGDAREQDPGRTRCFALENSDVTHDVEPGALVRIAYERAEDRDVATSIERYGRG